jgi:anthranilate synthase component 2
LILVIDNYDSFTFNLVQVLAAEGAEVVVVRNDELSVEDALRRSPDGILLSPGPGRPEDAGICPALVAARPKTPLLGVCLGHQVLGASFGGAVVRSPELMHGKTSAVRHDGRELFAGLSNPFQATRYHSLELEEDGLADEIEPVAWAESGALMGIRHRTLPYWGVQFHPESVLTVEGPRLLANFLALCESARRPGVAGGA